MSAPKRRVIDPKTHDTSADQLWRNVGHGMLTALCFVWLMLEPFTGVLVTGLIIVLVVKAARRREQRYSDNARAIAEADL